ncbi:hypothetical protein Tco_1023686 [Tanacetum coccineum]
MSNHATNWDKANIKSKIVNESLTTELERYKERVKNFEQRFNIDLSSREKFIDSQMNDMIRMKNTKFVAFETEIDTRKQTLSKHVKEKESLLTNLNGFKTEFKERESKSVDREIVLENKNKELENIVCKLYRSTQAMHMLTKPQVFYDNTHKQALGYQNPFYLKRAQWIKPILYDGNVLSKTHDVLSLVDEEETLILAEESRLKMVEKQNDPIMKKQKINITPINYSELNKLAKDFGKHFVPQQEVSTEKMFWLQSSNKNSEEPSNSYTPVKIEVPSELPKFDKGLLDKIIEVQTVFTQMEADVEQCSVNRKCCEIQQKQFLIENDRLLDKIISQEIVNIMLNSSVIICDSEKKNKNSMGTCNKCLKLEAELVKKNDVYLQAKDTVISKLKKTIHSLRENINLAKVKKDIDEIETINIELEHSVAKLLYENEKLHKEKEHLKKSYKELYDLIKPSRVHAKEQCDSLIANLKSKSMENEDLKTQIQEKVFANAALKNELTKLKGKNVIDTAVSKPYANTIALGIHSSGNSQNSNLDSTLAVTPNNKDKKVRFADPVTSSRNTQKHVDSHKPKDSNQPLLHSIGVISSTGASGSKPTGNTKNNRISQSSSSNKTNKVEDQSRSIKSRKNKKNRVDKTKCHAYVMQSMLNENSKSVCAICNECLFDENHDKCVLDYVHDVNVVQIDLWYLNSRFSKHMTGNRSQLTNFINKFLGTIKFGNDQIANIMGYSDYQIKNVTISRVYYVEGLGYNLFFVGQFSDSDLELFQLPQLVTPDEVTVPNTPSSDPNLNLFMSHTNENWNHAEIPFDRKNQKNTEHKTKDPTESFSQVVIPNNVHSVNKTTEHISKWTKDHLIDNVIGDPSRPVSTPHQLQNEAMFCYFDAFLYSVEPKSYKEALTESCWIEAMQEELNEF